MKIYVGCALTRATPEYRKSIEDFKSMLRENGHEVMDFLWALLKDPRDVASRDVYEYDINKCVKECDLMVAICDEPSLGCGYEIATAVEKYGKPVLAIHHKDIPLTRLIEGITHPNFSCKQYDDFSEAVALVEEKIKSIN